MKDIGEIKNNFLNSSSLLSREAYDFYRKNRKGCSKGINQYNLYKKAVAGLLLTVKRMMVQSEGGVYIDGIGYFCMMKNPFKRRVSAHSKSLFSRIRKEYKYFPYFLPDVELKGWTMDSSFFDTEYFKTDKIKYKLHFDLVSTMRIAQDYSIKSVHSRKVRGEFRYNSQLIKKINR